jgi:HEAT repeat protein
VFRRIQVRPKLFAVAGCWRYPGPSPSIRRIIPVTDMLWWTILKVRFGTDSMRRDAVRSLGRCQDARAVSVLSEVLLEDSDCFVRKEAADALGEIQDRRAVEPLTRVLCNSSDVHARAAAARALTKIGDLSSLEPLLKTILCSRSELEKRLYTTVRLHEPFVGRVRNDGEDIPRARQDDVAIFRELCAGRCLGAGSEERGAVDRLILALRPQQDPTIRILAIELLGEFSDPATEAALVGVLSCSGVRYQALKVLQKRGWKPQTLMHRVQVAIATGKYEDIPEEGSAAVAAVPALVADLSVSVEETAVRIARVLEKIGSPQAVIPLVKKIRENCVPDVLDALRQILSQSVSQVTSAGLEAVAGLPSQLIYRYSEFEWQFTANGMDYPGSRQVEKYVDCLPIREFALRELRRRQ